MLSKRQSVLRRQNTRPAKTVDDDHKTNQHSREIGKIVARDFGDAGVFRGEVVKVDYDSEDVENVEPIYVVQYTDGDRENMDARRICNTHINYICNA